MVWYPAVLVAFHYTCYERSTGASWPFSRLEGIQKEHSCPLILARHMLSDGSFSVHRSLQPTAGIQFIVVLFV